MSEVIPLKRTPRFRVVETPEQELTRLFEREHEIMSDLAEVRQEIEAARKRFGDKHELLANPRLELLRTRFLPPKAKP